MRTLLHLSDLHFGRVDAAVTAPLAAFAAKLEPDLVVVSGDLTQRARTEQFRQARRFLDTLPFPQIVVPGNHDVPLYDVVARFRRPLEKYRRYVTEDLEPVFVDGEIAVAGLSSARSLTFKGGRINAQQIVQLREWLGTLAHGPVKIVVSHHPFDLPADHNPDHIIGRAALAMHTFAAGGVDLLLAGHLHRGSTGSTAERYRIGDYSALVVQAGTATSTRGRGENNSFNVIRIEPRTITVERFEWRVEQGTFASAATESFRRTATGWSPGRDPD